MSLVNVINPYIKNTGPLLFRDTLSGSGFLQDSDPAEVNLIGANWTDLRGGVGSKHTLSGGGVAGQPISPRDVDTGLENNPLPDDFTIELEMAFRDGGINTSCPQLIICSTGISVSIGLRLGFFTADNTVRLMDLNAATTLYSAAIANGQWNTWKLQVQRSTNTTIGIFKNDVLQSTPVTATDHRGNHRVSFRHRNVADNGTGGTNSVNSNGDPAWRGVMSIWSGLQ